jgi:hypothetical protein
LKAVAAEVEAVDQDLLDLLEHKDLLDLLVHKDLLDQLDLRVAVVVEPDLLDQQV